MIFNKKFYFALTVFCAAFSAHAMNLLQPYCTLIRPDYSAIRPFQFFTQVETGYDSKGFNAAGDSVNALQIWDCDQNAIAMLKGFDAKTCLGQKRIQLDADDDGTRGHFNVCGDLDLRAAWSVNFRWFFADAWSVGFYFPFYSMQLKNVCWQDLTQDITDQDCRVKGLLTNDFFQNVCELGDGLDLTGWNRTGPGDLTVLLEWYRDFPQIKQLLRNVRVNWRFGFALPTGFREDPDKVFAVPFGYDGAFAVPFGLGLDFLISRYFKAGFDVQLTHRFGNTHIRRIKTDPCQTELLLLEKTCVYKDYGLIQRFNLYFELFKVIKAASVRVGYQYLKKGRDRVAFANNAYSAEIANTAQSLFDYTMHQIIVNAHYDVGMHSNYEARAWPQFEFFARFPFNGKRIAVNPTVGFSIAIDF